MISLASVVLKNDAGATIEAASGGSISWITGGVDNFGTFSAGNNGTITFGGDIDIINEVGGTFQAALGGSIVFGASDSGNVNNDGGTIVATDGGTITFDSTLTGAENTGIIEAGTGGTIIIDGFQGGNGLFNGGGTIEAIGAGAKVELAGATIIGGTLESSSGGVIDSVSGTSTLMNVTMTDGTDLKVETGAIVDLTGGGDPDHTLTIDGTVTFEGGGTVELDFTSYKVVAGSGGGTLDNETTIEGAGQIGNGDGRLTLNNQAGGTIDADVNGQEFILDTGNTVTNAGTLEATNGGTLQIDDAVTNSNMIEARDLGSAIVLAGGGSNSGTIEACGGGAITIDNNNNPSVFNSAMIVAGAGGTITINNTGDSGIWNSGTIEALTGGTLNIYDRNDHNIKNTGTIEADGGTINITHDHSSVINENLVEAINGGTINITNINNGDISGGGNAGTQKADGGTINVHGGAANLSGGTIEAINGGTFDIFNGGLNNAGGTAEAGSGGTFDINGGLNNASGAKVEALAGGTVNIDGGTVQNFGLIEALSGGIVTFDDGATIHNSGGAAIAALCGGTVNLNGTTVYNRNGSIEADGIGAAIMLAGAMIIGGTLETSAHGIIETVADSGNTTFDGVTIAAGSNVQVSDDTTLTLQDTFDCNGTVTNDGTITLGQGGDAGIIVNGNITLAGGGTVVLSGDTDSIVGTGAGTNILHNANTIEGSGTIGGDDLVFINQACGIVDADMCGHTLVLDTGYTVHNAGLLEATSGGTLEIDDNVCNTACGTISAAGHDSVVQLNGVTITGGTLETSCGGLIQVVCGSETTIECANIACGTDVEVDDGATLTLDNVTVTGTTFHDACNAVLAADGGTTLTFSGVTVHGGSIDGTDASGCIAASTIDVTGDSTFCGVRLSGGDLTVESNVTLTLSGDKVSDVAINGTDASGCIVASTIDVTGDSTFCDVSLTGGNLTVEGNVTLTLSGDRVSDVAITGTDASGCIVASTIDVTGDSTFCDVSLTGGNLTVEGDATLKLFDVTINGANIDDYTDSGCTVIPGTIEIASDSAINNSTVDGEGGPAGKGSPGVITVDCHATLTLDNTTFEDLNLTNNGALHIAGSCEVTFDSVNVTNNGCIDIDVANSGAILTLDDDTTITGGTLKIGSAGALDIATGNDGSGHGATLDGVHVTDCGALDVGDAFAASGAVLTLDDGTTVSGGGTGTMTINFGSTLDVERGTNDCHNGATLDGVIVQDNGTIDIGHAATGAVLTLDDGTTINGGGTAALTIHAGSTLDVENGNNGGGATLDDVHITDCGALDIGDAASGAILTLQDDATITGGGTGTMTIHANNTVDVETGINGGATLDGVHVTDNGALDIGDDLASGATLMLDGDTCISGCGTMTINANSTLDVDGGTSTINLGGTITNNGTIEASCGGTLDIVSHVDNSSGALEATSGGKLDIQSAICGGTATIDHGTLEFGAKSDVDVTFHNSNGYGELILDDAAGFSGKIFCFTGTDAGLSNSDEVFLTGVHEGEGGLTANYCSADNITTVIIDEQGGGSITLKFVGDYDADNFKLQQDANGLAIYDPPAGGGKQAPPKVTTAPQATDHATTSPSNLSGFGGNQDSTPGASTSEATSHDNEPAAPPDQQALGGKPVIAPLGGHANGSFVNGVAGVGAGEVGAATLTNVGVSTQSLLSSLLKTLTGGTDGTAPSVDLDTGHGQGQAALAPALAPTAPANEHTIASAHITSLPAASPTAASASFQIMGNDSFAFHANLGGNPAQNTDAHTSEIGHNNGQISGPALGSTAPEFHQEFAFDAIHQDLANLAATVDQFHQMASTSTLLH